ncbi:MAG: glycosyltransferase family 4 protein [Rhodospirillaceae bacterium]|nr:glycosyltransferase family 4 protein [Rhodospirillaceae bacterium]MBL6931216.1 glycosyltransferase family 4 protein [Rhodospirillales bacterium]MBL6941408.1 glycosyltransferase family 4 protein [Rhodospirillales bacterium]
MSRIVFADDGIEFDGKTPENGPLGGVESSVVNLMEELARRGHEVLVRNMCAAPLVHKGVDWAPIHSDRPYGNMPEHADLFIANRGDKLIDLMPKAGRSVFWIHNPANFLLKYRYLKKLWKVRPAIIFIGDYHATTYPRWAPAGERIVIPYGIPDLFRNAEPGKQVPAPRAVFTSNPLRSLDWLLDQWQHHIYPKVAGAELHVFSGAATYGSVGEGKAHAMDKVLEQARALEGKGVVLRGPVAKAQLVEEFRQARVLLYRGDINETFCLAVGEAQAMGVPAVVENLGSVSERVIDGKTGYVAESEIGFSSSAVSLLSDDDLWQTQHQAALQSQRRWGWPEAAKEFEKLIIQV